MRRRGEKKNWCIEHTELTTEEHGDLLLYEKKSDIYLVLNRAKDCGKPLNIWFPFCFILSAFLFYPFNFRMLLLSSFHRWGHGDSVRLSNLPVTGKTGILAKTTETNAHLPSLFNLIKNKVRYRESYLNLLVKKGDFFLSY